ncbi:hypothetical protein [Laspinema olomoucense]|uniref:ParB/Sulfiredoxin domain-containing protein n=1 Tax=Laspinema olomoucense D3b TaxID=2953688 RepID=A0ABT2N0R2_9CYAN|nr:hypothetical protein [Laspinema sp. D3b]MCT7976254.1 hypothetical protein [Laspinema sp. D3b]
MKRSYSLSPKSQKIVGPEVTQKLTILALRHTKIHDENIVAIVDPKELINYYRFDLMAKYIYAKYRELGIESDWALKLYCNNVKTMNGYKEPDGSGKEGKTAFIEEFNRVLDSIKESGFDTINGLVPMVNDYLVDGGHRTVACLLYNCEIAALLTTEIDENNPPIPLDYRHFEDRGFKGIFSDAMALEYCRLKPNTYLVIIEPSFLGKSQEVEDILKAQGRIYYQKDVFLWKSGMAHFKHHLALITGSQKKKPPRSGITRVYVFESETLEEAIAAKQKLNALWDYKTESVYLTQTHEQTLELAELLLNENSIRFLNRTQLNPSSRFHEQLSKYRQELEENQIDSEWVCLSDRAVLAAYGIRDCDQLDVLHKGFDQITQLAIASSHNSQLPANGLQKDDIIFNPEHYFYYAGLKFASLDTVIALKQARKTPQDLEDLQAISTFLNAQKLRQSQLAYAVQLAFSPWGIYWLKKHGTLFFKRLGRALFWRSQTLLAKVNPKSRIG